MSKKSETTLTFSVKIKVPTGMNVPEAQSFIRAAIFDRARAVDPIINLEPTDFTVALVKKETTYGQR